MAKKNQKVRRGSGNTVEGGFPANNGTLRIDLNNPPPGVIVETFEETVPIDSLTEEQKKQLGLTETEGVQGEVPRENIGQNVGSAIEQMVNNEHLNLNNEENNGVVITVTNQPVIEKEDDKTKQENAIMSESTPNAATQENANPNNGTVVTPTVLNPVIPEVVDTTANGTTVNPPAGAPAPEKPVLVPTNEEQKPVKTPSKKPNDPGLGRQCGEAFVTGFATGAGVVLGMAAAGGIIYLVKKLAGEDVPAADAATELF